MRRLIRLHLPFRKDAGHCWVARLPRAEAFTGDTDEQSSASGLVVLENGVPLGPAHMVHDDIRRKGGGRYSHWKDRLYFSTSNNSNPNFNGRQYHAYLPETQAQDLSQVGADEALLLAAMQENVNNNGRALHNLFHCYRMLHRFLGAVGETVQGKHILEIGASPTPGLPLAVLASGAARYYANNIVPIGTCVSEAYARMIALALSGLLPYDPISMTRLGRGGAPGMIELDPDKFATVSPVPAEDIALPDGSVDLAFSISVLEHVRKPQAVIRNMFRMLRPGGVAVHSIDLRDHTNFDRPLAFLRYSADTYATKTPATENRWRASEFLRCFAEEGFEILDQRFLDRAVPLTSTGRTDIMAMVLQPFDELWSKTSFEQVTPWVTEQLRSELDTAYQSNSLADLSTLALAVTVRRP